MKKKHLQVGILKVEDTGRYLNYTIEDDQS